MSDSELVEIIKKHLNRRIEIKTKIANRIDIIYHGILRENNEKEKYVILENIELGLIKPEDSKSAQIWYSVIEKESIKELD